MVSAIQSNTAAAQVPNSTPAKHTQKPGSSSSTPTPAHTSTPTPAPVHLKSDTVSISPQGRQQAEVAMDQDGE
ncbi:hypothetical protein ACOBR2_12895 [Telmatobacter bradus]|uniref:hypothetical protein n=1 Tax=Telmatobacter bradus TaxID=474953 RepID=UPI003B42BFD1